MLLGQVEATHGMTWLLMGILIVLCVVIFALLTRLREAKSRIKELEDMLAHLYIVEAPGVVLTCSFCVYARAAVVFLPPKASSSYSSSS